MRLMKLITEKNKNIYINPAQFVSVFTPYSGRTIVETAATMVIVKNTPEDVAKEFLAAMVE